jgi:hypothetical protein
MEERKNFLIPVVYPDHHEGEKLAKEAGNGPICGCIGPCNTRMLSDPFGDVMERTMSG